MSRLAAWALTAVVGLAGCGSRQAAGPPVIRYGEAACAECRMLISEERFAAAARSVGGETAVFDDIGCLIRHVARWHAPPSHVWVHAYETGAWVDGRHAWYVRSNALMTPMGSGIAAFAGDAEGREAAASLRGEVVPFVALQEEERACVDASPSCRG